MSQKKPNPVSAYFAKIGAKGGKTTGESKARSSRKARLAALARWSKKK